MTGVTWVWMQRNTYSTSRPLMALKAPSSMQPMWFLSSWLQRHENDIEKDLITKKKNTTSSHCIPMGSFNSLFSDCRAQRGALLVVHHHWCCLINLRDCMWALFIRCLMWIIARRFVELRVMALRLIYSPTNTNSNEANTGSFLHSFWIKGIKNLAKNLKYSGYNCGGLYFRY